MFFNTTKEKYLNRLRKFFFPFSFFIFLFFLPLFFPSVGSDNRKRTPQKGDISKEMYTHTKRIETVPSIQFERRRRKKRFELRARVPPFAASTDRACRPHTVTDFPKKERKI
jgi:hypothetical protein